MQWEKILCWSVLVYNTNSGLSHKPFCTSMPNPIHLFKMLFHFATVLTPLVCNEGPSHSMALCFNPRLSTDCIISPTSFCSLTPFSNLIHRVFPTSSITVNSFRYLNNTYYLVLKLLSLFQLLNSLSNIV